jgi:hypothetical protein
MLKVLATENELLEIYGIKKFPDQPIGTDEVVHIENINVIPEDFKKTETGSLKILRAVQYYQRNGHLDKPISVIAETNERGNPNTLVLIDEYSRYQAADSKHLNLAYVPVKYIDIDKYCDRRNI